MQTQRLVRPVAGPWYARSDFMHVYRVTDTLLDEWVRIGWVEERHVHGRSSYRTSALAGKVRLLRAAATTVAAAVDRPASETADTQTAMRAADQHGPEHGLSDGASLPLRALNDLVTILCDMPGDWPDEQRDRLLVTLGILAGSIAASARSDDAMATLLENLQRLAARRAPGD